MEDIKKDKKQRVQGMIAIVQEERFRLITGDGRGLLLTLARNAPLDNRDLQRLYYEGLPVEVEYSGEPNEDSGVVYCIKSVQPDV
jgi:hypothetical protein